MEQKIIQQTKNPLLGREEYLIEIVNEGNPSFEDVKKVVGKDESLTVVKKIDGGFGKNVFNTIVYVYDSKEDMEKVEPKSKKKEDKPADAPAVQVVDAPKEDAPAKEEKTEEAKE